MVLRNVSPRPLLVLSGVIVALAAWRWAELQHEVRLGMLGRGGARALAPVLGVLWSVAWGGLARFLGRGRGEAEARDIARRVAAAALAGALAGLIPHLSWRYGRWLVRGRTLAFGVPLLVGAALLVVLEGRRLRAAAPRICFLLVAPALVLLGEGFVDWAMLRELNWVPDHATLVRHVWMVGLNSLVVAGLLGVVLGILGRPVAAVALVAACVLLLAVANGMKLWNLQAPLRVYDVDSVDELGAVLADVFGDGFLWGLRVLFVAAVAALGVVLWRGRGRGVRWPLRIAAGMGGLAFLVTLPAWVLTRAANGREQLIGGHELAIWEPRQDALQNGLFLYLRLDLHRAGYDAPPGYGRAEVERILAGIEPRPADRPTPPGPAEPHLVLLLVESLLDPGDLGLALDRDPIPFLHSLEEQHGRARVVSPVFGGTSANAEFELLTGFPIRLLPGGVLAYDHYVRRDLPAWPRFFSDLGYRTASVVAAPSTFFNRPQVYPRLGFERSAWLDGEEDVARDARGRVADSAVVDRILEIAAGEGPAFVFAFNDATHASYDRALFPDGPVRVLEDPDSRWGAELEGYANALHRLDGELERLVRGLEALERPSVVAILGDHLPPFRSPDSLYDRVGFWPADNHLELLRRRHCVPAYLWTNLPGGARLGTHRGTHRGTSRGGDPPLCSTNFFALEALGVMGVAPQGFQGFLAATRDALPSISHVVAFPGGEVVPWDGSVLGLDPVRDLALLQYDLLAGRGYARGVLIR